jgi:S-DNA-T family DNA segregation ATPase FtsK/SpoIIIE
MASTRNRTSQPPHPIPPVIWTLLGIAAGTLMLTRALPALPVVWLGMLASGVTAKPPQPRSGRRTDPIDPRDQRRYDRWKALKHGLLPNKDWTRWRRVSWWVALTCTLPTMHLHPLPLQPLDTMAGFMIVMGVTRMLDRRKDMRHPYTGVSVTAFHAKAAPWKRITAICAPLIPVAPAYMLTDAPWNMLVGIPILLHLLLVTILDRTRQSTPWRRRVEWQHTLDGWVNEDASPIGKAWQGVTVSQVSVLGDRDDPLTVIRIRYPQGNQNALKLGVTAIRPLATQAGHNITELLEARHGDAYDPNALRLVLAHDEKAIPDTTRRIDERLATLVTDIAFARTARTWNKRAPLTKAHQVAQNDDDCAWLITLTLPPEGGSTPDLISLNWLADPQTGPQATLRLPVEADLYDAYYLAMQPGTPVSDTGNKWRPKGRLTDTRHFNDYVLLSARYRSMQNMWVGLLPAKLKPPIPDYDREETLTGDGWSLTLTPFALEPPATPADYAKIDLSRLDPEARFTGVNPGTDGSSFDLVRVKGGAPDGLGMLNGGGPQQRYYARAIVFRALVNALPASKGTVSLDSCTQEGKDVSVWRANVTTGEGATVADLRKRAPAIQAQTGSKLVLWDWRSPSETTLWFMPGRLTGVEDAQHFKQRRRQKEILPLALSDAWGVAGVSDDSGRTPKVVELGVFPRNHSLLKVRFRIPAGMSMSRIDANQDKFLTAAGYGYGRILPRGDEHGADLWDMALSKGSPFPTMVHADWDCVRHSDSLTLPLGVDDMGEPVSWNVHDTYHIAVMGKSGTGKSSAAQIIVADALLHGWKTIIIDPSKGAIDFTQWAQPLSLAYVGNGQLDETEATIRWVEDEMNKRVRMLSEHGAGNILDLPEGIRPDRLLVVFDEFNGYLTKIGKTAPNPNRDISIANDNARIQAQNNSITRTMSALSKIALQGRTAGISLLIGGQRLGIKDFEKFPGGTQFYRTLGRLLLGNDTPEGVISPGNVKEAHRQQAAMKGEGGQVPKGRGLWEDMDGRMTCIQAWYGGGQDALKETVKGITPPRPIDITPFMPEHATMLGEVTRHAEQATQENKAREQEISRKVQEAEEITVDWDF